MAAEERKEVVVTVKGGLDEYGIEFIQQIRRNVDYAMSGVGFSRTVSCMGDTVEFTYCRFSKTP